MLSVESLYVKSSQDIMHSHWDGRAIQTGWKPPTSIPLPPSPTITTTVTQLDMTTAQTTQAIQSQSTFPLQAFSSESGERYHRQDAGTTILFGLRFCTWLVYKLGDDVTETTPWPLWNGDCRSEIVSDLERYIYLKNPCILMKANIFCSKIHFFFKSLQNTTSLSMWYELGFDTPSVCFFSPINMEWIQTYVTHK